MRDELIQIKSMRKSLNMTQKELAAKASVSQSLIAKIESGRIDPAYSKIRKIIESLESVANKENRKAGDIMESCIIKLSPNDTIKAAIRKMKNKSISQLPVFEDKQPVGLVSESLILNALTEDFDADSAVENIMDDAPPTISKDTSINVVINLLKQFPILIVSEKGRPKGLIAKSDMFNIIYK